jgi:hypothetical protein
MQHIAPSGGRTKSEFERWQIRRRLRELGLELGPLVDVSKLDLAPLCSTGDVDADGQVAGRAA